MKKFFLALTLMMMTGAMMAIPVKRGMWVTVTLAESEERLAWQKQNDPFNIGDFKATKGFMNGNNSFDDRSYIRFKV